MRATTKDHLRSGGNVALAALLTLLCLYGLFSTPGLAARWGWSWPGAAVLAAGAALMLGARWQAGRPITVDEVEPATVDPELLAELLQRLRLD